MTFSDSIPSLRDIDHIRGSASAALLLIAYGNYQCPESGASHRSVENLRQSLGDRLCFAFRHFPNRDRYPQSQKAAETAEAAGSQGKFWEMHDRLFERQDHLEDADLVEYADELGLDVQKFLQELSRHVHAEHIQADVETGKQYGVTDTPTFFVSLRHQGNNIESLVKQILKVTVEANAA